MSTLPSARRTESSETAGEVRIPKARLETAILSSPTVHGRAAALSFFAAGAASVRFSRMSASARTSREMPAVLAERSARTASRDNSPAAKRRSMPAKVSL